MSQSEHPPPQFVFLNTFPREYRAVFVKGYFFSLGIIGLAGIITVANEVTTKTSAA